MKTLAVGTALVALLTVSPALAAPPMMDDWTGYIGIGGSLNGMSVDVGPGSLSDLGTPGTSFSATGGMVDLYGGVITSNGDFFYGLEGGLSLGVIEGTNSELTVPSLTVNAIGSLTGIIGTDLGGITLYGRAGPAFALGDATEDHGDGPKGESAVHVGGIVAVGLEHAVSDTMKIRGEVSVSKFMTATYDFPESVDHSHDVEFSVARAGISLLWAIN